MRSHLRTLALSVEAQEAHFVWCLRECTGDPVVFEPIERAGVSSPTYSAALAAGYAHWQRLMATEAERGPQTRAEDENADPVGSRVSAGPLLPPRKLSRRSGHGAGNSASSS